MKRDSPQNDQLYSVKSAAAFLGGVAESTVRKWLTDGKLTRVKIGRLTRIREHDLSALIVTERRGNGRP